MMEVLYAHHLSLIFQTDKTALPIDVQLLLQGTSLTNEDGTQHQESDAFAVGTDTSHHIFGGVPLHFLSADGTEGLAHTSI